MTGQKICNVDQTLVPRNLRSSHPKCGLLHPSTKIVHRYNATSQRVCKLLRPVIVLVMTLHNSVDRYAIEAVLL